MKFGEVNPRLIDNKGFSLKDAIEHHSKEQEELSIATGYIDLKVFQTLRSTFSGLKKIRILIGMEPQLRRYMLSEPYSDFPEKDLINDLNEENFSDEYKEIVIFIKEMIKNKKLEIKILKNKFLHAKCYIYGNYLSSKAIGIVGSSNLTQNGLYGNYELNYIEDNDMVVKYKDENLKSKKGHLRWFEEMWNDENSLDWNFEFLNLVEVSPVGDILFSPYETYIKTISEVFNSDIYDDDSLDNDSTIESTTQLFKFQKENTQMLIEKMKRNKVALLSDSVGLGKTLTAINVIKKYKAFNQNSRIEIISPANLIQHWQKELKKEKLINISVTSKSNFTNINERQNLDEIANVELFIIDESHNYRNINSETYAIMSTWIKNNPQSHVLMLTATPINNSLTDLRNQLLLGTGGDVDRFYLNYIDAGTSTLLNWFDYINKVQSDIRREVKEFNTFDNEKLKNKMSPIVRQFVVRRTRQGIEKRYGNLKIDGKDNIFPNVIPKLEEYELSNIDYKPEDLNFLKIPLNIFFQIDPEEIAEITKQKLLHPSDILNSEKKKFNLTQLEHPMSMIFHLILLLGLAPYSWQMYRKNLYGKDKSRVHNLIKDTDTYQRINMQLNFYGIFRSIFLKRMESSIYAFKISIERYLKILNVFKKGLDNNLFLSTRVSDQLISIFNESEDESSTTKEFDDNIFNLIENYDEKYYEKFDNKDYEIDILKKDIDKDIYVVKTILEILSSLENQHSKLTSLINVVTKIKKEQPNAKVLIFSYFEDTLEYVKSTIFELNTIFNTENTEFISSSNLNSRETVLDRFSPRSRGASVDKELEFLFSTDVLSEGQNLQDSNYVVNYDLHWNPVRMIQRNGRVNRLGSEFENVYIYNFKPEAKLDKYLKLISKLESKIDLIKNTIGTDSPVLIEPAQPIDYIDLIETIYSVDEKLRIKTLEDLNYQNDIFFSDEIYINDLIDFKNNNEESYINTIFGIHKNKWHLCKSIINKEEAYVLVKTFDSTLPGTEFFQVFKYKSNTLTEQDLMSFLSNLRNANIELKERVPDEIMIDREEVKTLVKERLSITSTKKPKNNLYPKDKKFLKTVDPEIDSDFSLPTQDFKVVVEAFQTTNQLDLKKFRKFRDQILNEKIEKKEKLNTLDQFVIQAHQLKNNKSKTINYDTSYIICNYSNY